MVLRSFDSKEVHKHNETFDFRVKLDTPLCLDGSWVVAMTEITMDKLKTSYRKQNFYVYSNICKESFVGPTLLPLLRKVYFTSTFGMIYDTPSYTPVNSKYIHDIHIYIKDDTDKIASYLTGDLTVTLHLKKLNYFQL